MSSFEEATHVARFGNAHFFAAELFHESFALPFPVPRDNCGLSIPTPPENWRQYVAFYKWPHGATEVVGFCNWIRYRDVYLEGGMCVKRNFYRRLPKDHWESCRDAGGIAQIMMEFVARELNDCVAWFGYCGDKKAMIVNLRGGYARTRNKYLIVKWFSEVSADAKNALIEHMASIGPF